MAWQLACERGPVDEAAGQVPLLADHATAGPWLPQPAWFADHTTERALADTGSFWHLYRDGLHLRATLPQLGEGPLRWLDAPPQVLAFVRGDGLVCAVNFGATPLPAPVEGEPLLASRPCPPGTLPGNTAAWWTTDRFTASTT